MKHMDAVWKAQYDRRATLDMPDHKKSFWSKDGQGELLEVTLELVKKLDGVKTILDVGCGPGLYSERLSERGYDVLGVDYSENTIGLAKEKYPNLKFMVADGYNLPFEDNSFDLVISIGALQCLIETERFVKELLRVSKKAVIISTLLKKKKSKDPMRTLREQLKNDSFPCREYHPSELLPFFGGMKVSVITTHNGKEISEGGFIVARYD